MHRYLTGPSALILMTALSGAPTTAMAEGRKLCSVLQDRDGDPVVARDSESIAHRNSKKCPNKDKAEAKAKAAEEAKKATETAEVENIDEAAEAAEVENIDEATETAEVENLDEVAETAALEPIDEVVETAEVENLDEAAETAALEPIDEVVETADKAIAVVAVETGAAVAGVAGSQVTEPMSIYFDLGQKGLDATSRAKIEAYAADIVKTSPRWLGVIGYTDTTGAADLNKRVSEERSQNVVVALLKAGVPASVIVRDAAGEDDLANETPDDTLDANNRRVTITPSY